MRTPDAVSAMLKLKDLEWGAQRIAAERGCSKNTVKRWLELGGWQPCAAPSRSKRLAGLGDGLAERFRCHGGKADVVRQELAAEKGVVVSLRTVERAVAPRPAGRGAGHRAVRDPPRREQLQIDFGERRVSIGGGPVKVFVATLGYSRRLPVRASGHEKQESWFDGMERAFRAFGGVPEEGLLGPERQRRRRYSARALVVPHAPASREVVVHPRLHAFARHWGFRVRACAPIAPAPRARTSAASGT